MDINSAAIFEELQLRKEVDEHGTVRYYNLRGRLHRTNGPAIIWLTNHNWRLFASMQNTRTFEEYWIDGIRYSKSEFNLIVRNNSWH